MSNRLQHRVFALSALLCAAVTAAAPGAATAQVGHAPESSPYRELNTKYQISATAGYSWGGGGKVGVGPGHGTVYGGRADIHLAGPGAIQLGVNVGSLDRVMIDPTAAPDARILGTVKQSVVMADVGLNLVLTGEKTWHGFAPYFGASAGIAIGGSVPEDSLSGYEFKTKFLVGPQIGFRWQIFDRLSARVDARDVIWRLSYPDRFFEAPEDYPDQPVLDPQFNKNTQWTHNPMLLFSLGYSFGS